MKTQVSIQKKRAGFAVRLAVFACAGVIWMSPFQYSLAYAVPLAGFFAAILLIDLIPQRIVMFAVYLVFSCGFSIYDERFSVCFAPFLGVCYMLRSILRDPGKKAAKYDGLFFAGMVSLAVFTAVGFFRGGTRFSLSHDYPFQFHRQYAALAALFFVFLCYILRSPQYAGKKEGTFAEREKNKKLRAVFIVALLGFPAVFAYISASDDYICLSAYPAFVACIMPLLTDAVRIGSVC